MHDSRDGQGEGSGSGLLREPEGLSLVRLLSLALHYRRLVLLLPLASGLAFLLWAGLRPRTFTSSASFIPQSRRLVPSGAAGLAAQLGFAVPGDGSGDSPAFYVDLLQTQDILRQVVETRYAFSVDGESHAGNFIDLNNVQDATPERRRDRAVRRLVKAMAVSRGRESGLVRLAVKARWAPLAQQIAQRMLDLVSEFNLEKRQSQAAAERKFTEERSEQARTELLDAENRLQRFLQRNRDFGNDPSLTFERDRLAREVVMRQQVYTSLSEAYEQARIDEVRNTPVITVVEPPTQPVKPDSRGFIEKGLLGAVLGGLLGAFLSFGRHAVSQSREGLPEEFNEFVRARNDTLDDVRRAWRRVTNVFR